MDGRSIVLHHVARTLAEMDLSVEFSTRDGFATHEFLESQKEVRSIADRRVREDYSIVWTSSPASLRSLRRAFPTAFIVLGLNDLKTSMAVDRLYREVTYLPDVGRILKSILRIPVTLVRETRSYRLANMIHVQTEKDARIGNVIYRDKFVAVMNGVNIKSSVARKPVSSFDVTVYGVFEGLRKREASCVIKKILESGRSVELLGSGSAELGTELGLEFFENVQDITAFLSTRRVVVIPTDHGTGVVNRVLDCVNATAPFVTFRRTLATASFLELDPALHSVLDLSQFDKRLAAMENEREGVQLALVRSATLLRSWGQFRSELSAYLACHLEVGEAVR